MKKDITKIIVSLALFIFAITIKFQNIWINKLIYIIAYIIVGFEVVKEALENILHRRSI